MKSFAIIFLLLSISSLPQPAWAQQSLDNCNDVGIRIQADVVKENLFKQGLKLFQEANIAMDNMQPTPIVVRLHQGTYYQFVFIGHPDASKLEFEMYDGKDKLIDERTVKSSSQLVYACMPAKTDDYLITITQKKNARNLCGYFAVLMLDKEVKDLSNNHSGNKNRPISETGIHPKRDLKAAPEHSRDNHSAPNSSHLKMD